MYIHKNSTENVYVQVLTKNQIVINVVISSFRSTKDAQIKKKRNTSGPFIRLYLQSCAMSFFYVVVTFIHPSHLFKKRGKDHTRWSASLKLNIHLTFANDNFRCLHKTTHFTI